MKVIRYKDFSKSIESIPNENGIVDMQMYFSVYELSNGKIICLETIKYYNEKNNVFEWGEFSDNSKYNFSYLEDFNFEDQFHDWFHKIPKWTPDTKWPTQEEEALTINYYQKYIKKI